MKLFKSRLFFNTHCLICSTSTDDAEELCDTCQAKMHVLDPHRLCKTCGIEMAREASACGNCLKTLPYFNETHAVWAYDDLSSHLIQRLKFYEDFSTLPFLVESLAARLREEYAERDFPEVIMPVPVHFWRLFKRGFNQTEELGKRLAKKLDLPFDDRTLHKVKNTGAQLALHVEERAKNLKAAFKLKGPLPYQSIALLDDVMTTGATANEIAQCLKKAGALEVHIWVLARALI